MSEGMLCMRECPISSVCVCACCLNACVCVAACVDENLQTRILNIVQVG